LFPKDFDVAYRKDGTLLFFDFFFTHDTVVRSAECTDDTECRTSFIAVDGRGCSQRNAASTPSLTMPALLDIFGFVFVVQLPHNVMQLWTLADCV